jgi:hypothetical protein
MSGKSYSEPVALIVCDTKEQALVIESLLLSEGILVERREEPSSVGEPVTGQLGGGPSEAVTLYVPTPQLAQAREILTQARSNP